VENKIKCKIGKKKERKNERRLGPTLGACRLIEQVKLLAN
jgi:hypothetical protein